MSQKLGNAVKVKNNRTYYAIRGRDENDLEVWLYRNFQYNGWVDDFESAWIFKNLEDAKHKMKSLGDIFMEEVGIEEMSNLEIVPVLIQEQATWKYKLEDGKIIRVTGKDAISNVSW